MAKNMWKNDPYDIRKFKCGDISTFVDIGANQGLATLTAFGAWHDDQCRYVMVEPFSLTLETAETHLGRWVFHMGGEIHNLALGNGEVLYFGGGEFHGEYKFYTQAEFDAIEAEDGREAFKTTDEYLKTPVQSYSLPNLFQHLKIDQTKEYFLKIDCEGGERFIFDDPEAISIIAGSAQTAMEVHYTAGLTAEIFVRFCLHMSKTHVVRRTVQDACGVATHLVIEPDELRYVLNHPNKGWCNKIWRSLTEATFVRKDWAHKTVSNQENFMTHCLQKGYPIGQLLLDRDVD